MVLIVIHDAHYKVFASSAHIARRDDGSNMRKPRAAMNRPDADLGQAGIHNILAVASRQAIEPAAMVGAYSASKAALVALIRTIALENKDQGIAANTVLPATMDTPGNRTDPNADRSRWVQPSQVAALLVHLASDAGAQITGAAIPVYGGQL